MIIASVKVCVVLVGVKTLTPTSTIMHVTKMGLLKWGNGVIKWGNAASKLSKIKFQLIYFKQQLSSQCNIPDVKN